MKNFALPVVVVGILTVLNPLAVKAQDHGHLNIGSTGTDPGDPLVFDNGADFATNSLYVKTLTTTNAGPYAGYYQGNITVTVLAATPANGGPAPGAPALGSWIFAQLVSVEGPSGGEFGFWESGATTPTISLSCGASGTNLWRISQSNGSPGLDPFGHIHGRRFSATKPGIYVVAFRAFDLSTNGIAGAPIHTPSDVVKIYFQAGVTISTIEAVSGIANITFGSMAGYDWHLEYADVLGLTNSWKQTPDSLAGDDHFQQISDLNATNTMRFYRIRGVSSD